MDSSVRDTKFKQQVENSVTAKTTETMIPFHFPVDPYPAVPRAVSSSSC